MGCNFIITVGIFLVCLPYPDIFLRYPLCLPDQIMIATTIPKVLKVLYCVGEFMVS